MQSQPDPINDYVTALDEQRLRNGDKPDQDLTDAALSELQGMGAMAWPVEGGEWLLRADRDEDGAFIAASFNAEQP